MGTVAYLAPELVVRGVADARTDVYAVGVMLFEMLTGRQPFTGDVPIQVAYRHVHEEVPPPSSVVRGLPEPLDVLVATAAAREPDLRPRDAGALRALERSVRTRIPAAALGVRPALGRAPATRPAHTQLLAPGDDDAPPGLLPAGVAPEPRRAHTDPQGPDGDDDPLAAQTEVLAVWSRRRAGAASRPWPPCWPWPPGSACGPGGWRWGRRVHHAARAHRPGRLAGPRRAGRPPPAADDPHRLRRHRARAARRRLAPGPGDRARHSGVVVLDVPLGPEYVRVADVAGAGPAEAGRRLSAAGLVAVSAPAVYDAAPAGVVVRTQPGAGERVRSGSTVTVTTSRGRGRPPSPTCGASRRRAPPPGSRRPASWCSAMRPGSTTGPTRVPWSPPGASWTRRPRAARCRGLRVRLAVSKGPVMVRVPAVVGLQLAAARPGSRRPGSG